MVRKIEIFFIMSVFVIVIKVMLNVFLVVMRFIVLIMVSFVIVLLKYFGFEIKVFRSDNGWKKYVGSDEIVIIRRRVFLGIFLF